MKPIDITTTIAIARKEASLAISDAIPLIADMVPIPENGRDGIDGRDGLSVKGDKGDKGDPGETGPRGPKGNDGKDGANGVGIREAWVDPDDGQLYVELTNGRTVDAGVVKGRDGKDGKDGAIIIGGADRVITC